MLWFDLSFDLYELVGLLFFQSNIFRHNTKCKSRHMSVVLGLGPFVTVHAHYITHTLAHGSLRVVSFSF